jgi:Mrp family chromosome partitioning ATPase
MCRRAGVPIVGAVESMAAFVCPDRGRRVEFVSRVPEPRSPWAAGAERLGEIPLDRGGASADG